MNTIQNYAGRVIDLDALFARIPDDVALRMATRDFDLSAPTKCLCGWAMRESFATVLGKDADNVSPFETGHLVIEGCVHRFGGDYDDWEAVYWGVTNPHKMPDIETAFVDRIDAAVTHPSTHQPQLQTA